ncbi:MAG: hypothetical protein ACU0CI_10445 [Shimia sp.]
MAADPKEQRPNLGIYDRQMRGKLSSVEWVAFAFAGLWLVGTAIYFLGFGGTGGLDPALSGQLQFILIFLFVFLPVAVIWTAASAARSARLVREEGRRLQAAIDAMRQTYVANQQAGGMLVQPTLEKKLEEVVEQARETQETVATFATARGRDSVPAGPMGDAPVRKAEPVDHPDQRTLELGTPREAIAPPLPNSDFIRALNFPENPDDQEGFASLRLALKDRKASVLVQASQDVLTLLSQDGIYMDDLRPDRARPEFWRRFAQGERGGAVAVLGGIRDRSSLALAAGRMRTDPVFRDAVHHFLRRFDMMLTAFEPGATDEEIVELSDTRTARAFMLCGRVTGMFS